MWLTATPSALGWLDTTLADMKYQPDMRTYALIKTVLKETLTSCDVLDGQNYVNTGTVSDFEEVASANQPRLQTRQHPTF